MKNSRWAVLASLPVATLLTSCGDTDGAATASPNPCLGQETDFGVVWCVPDTWGQEGYSLFVNEGVVSEGKLHSTSAEVCSADGGADRYSEEATSFVVADLQKIQVRRAMEDGEESNPGRVGLYIFDQVAFDASTIQTGCQTVALLQEGGQWHAEVVDTLRP